MPSVALPACVVTRGGSVPSPALLGGGMQHVWLYWVGPLIGGVLASLVYKNILAED